MRFEINIVCSPEEARAFFGVPDMMPMQQAMMDKMNSHLMDNMKTMDAETFTETWMPAMFRWSEMQQNFWKQMGQMGGVNINTEPKSKK